ncbi:U3 small nucleolar RNA-associated protein 14 A [Araneus ventricosus]|uniref:U3 small nucleolar RNA-associated protein 14 A n=1 Tax=Araneus ventricosus TaxID=182803 RepID=A0A4Y2ICE9_ARAVE|nr:U3 small nucleolar RNA-associated protein 14 A [Araneus ventricosus]
MCRSVPEEQCENSNEMLDVSDVPVPENADENIDSPSLNNKKKFKKMAAQRSEASLNVSEFDLNEVGKETIKLNELIKTSQKLSGAGSVKKQLEKVKKLQSLSVPLSKPQMTKIKRTMGYTKVCDELKRWEPVVRNNRAAEQIIFPLKKPEVQLESFENASEKYVLKHPVAVAVDELLQKSENVLQKDKPMTEAEEKALKAMSLEEKISSCWNRTAESKNYRNDKQIPNIEAEPQTDPPRKQTTIASFVKILDHLKRGLQNLGQLSPVTELLEEASIPNFSHDDISSAAKDQETESLIDKLCIVKEIRNAKPKKKPANGNAARKDIPDIIDINFITEASNLDSYNPSGISIGDAFDEIDNDDEGDEKSGGMDISEALADEEIIEEFKEDKRAAEEASRPKGIDLFLPGWGSWAGAGIKISKKKRERFYIPPPEEPAPKKNTLGNVIVNEDRDKKAAVHQVSTLPFPFSNIHQFEGYIRQPVGHTWNPPSSFRSLTEPRVVTKAGKMIEPIDPEDVVLDNTTKKEPQKKKRRKKVTHEIKAF